MGLASPSHTLCISRLQPGLTPFSLLLTQENAPVRGKVPSGAARVQGQAGGVLSAARHNDSLPAPAAPAVKPPPAREPSVSDLAFKPHNAAKRKAAPVAHTVAVPKRALPGLRGLDLEALRGMTWQEMCAAEAGMTMSTLLDAGPPTAVAHRFDTRARLVGQEAHILKLQACARELHNTVNAVHVASHGTAAAAAALAAAQSSLDVAKAEAARFRAEAADASAAAAGLQQRLTHAEQSAQAKGAEAAAAKLSLASAHAQVSALVAELDAARAAHASVAGASAQLGEVEQRLAAALERGRQLEATSEAAIAAAARAEAQAAALQSSNAQAQRAAQEAQARADALEARQGGLGAECAALGAALDAAQTQLASANTAAAAATSRAQAAELAASAALYDLETARGDAAAQRGDAQALRQRCDAMTAQLAGLSAATADAQHATSRAEALGAQVNSQAAQLAELRAQFAAQTQALAASQEAAARAEAFAADADARLAVGEQQRARLHAQLQELRGAIRVVCRVRPMGPGEDEAGPAAISFPADRDLRGRGVILTIAGAADKKLSASASALSSTSQAPTYTFAFDRTFGPLAGQGEVFEEVEPVIQTALDGGRCCVFAYGPTGTGKTHTMLGIAAQPGVVPLALDMIFKAQARAGTAGWVSSVTATALEVYCNDVHDLLAPHASSSPPTVDVKLDGVTGEACVPAATVVALSGPAQAATVIAAASAARATGATQCNARSSRSHLVVTLHLAASHEASGEARSGILHLVDLAGSERLSRSGSADSSVSLKETQAINSSLSSLGDVIAALGAKAAHVPYRNSALTWLLSSSLGPDSTLLMLTNVAPCTGPAAQETLCTLRFGAKASACELATAKKRKGELGGLLAQAQAKRVGK
jgi:kinesin family protein C1